MKLVLIGGGGHCKSIIDAVLRLGKYQEIVVTDPSVPEGEEILGCRVVGDDKKLEPLFDEGFTDAFISVGSIKSTELRRMLFRKARKIGFNIPALIDPSALVSHSVKVGDGAFISKNTVINAGVEICDMAIVNTGAIVEHDCKVGEFTHVATGSTICGGCIIGDDVLVGAGATVIQGIRISDGSIIPAGSVITKDVGV